MRVRHLVLVFSILLLLHSALNANIRKEFLDTEKLFLNGNLDGFTGALLNLKPSNDEERAFVAFHNAILKKDSETSITQLTQLTSKFSNTRYGQLGFLELAKIFVLKRDISQAMANLRKITATDLDEKSYWQAVCSYQQGDWQTAINHSETFLRLSPSSIYTEDAYYLIANSYINQNKAHSAITALNKLKSIKDLPTDLQYFHYRLGYAYELNRSTQDALSQYRTGYLLNKYSQIAYQIEDRLFALKAAQNNIDLNFLYPYVELQLGEVTVVTPPPQTPATPVESISQASSGQALKVSDKPSGDYLIQAGRFSNETNAENLVKRIRSFDLPAVYYEAMHNNQKTWVVVCGPYSTQQDAIFAHTKLREHEVDCFITRN